MCEPRVMVVINPGNPILVRDSYYNSTLIHLTTPTDSEFIVFRLSHQLSWYFNTLENLGTIIIVFANLTYDSEKSSKTERSLCTFPLDVISDCA